MAFFSVIIPTYNCADKLHQTIQSVLNQTFSDLEVLVMDDGSSDNTEAVVEAFQDTRIRYDWAENSGGPATPRNRGIEVAQAEWVCFLDADDVWYANKLEVVAQNILECPDVDVLCHNEIVLNQCADQRSILHYGPYEDCFYRILLTEGNRLSTSATTVRYSFLERYKLRFEQNPDYVIVEDYDFWLKLAEKGAMFHFIDTPLGEYLITYSNISLDTSKAIHNESLMLHDHVYQLQNFEPDKDTLWRQVSVRLMALETYRMLEHGDYLRALKNIFKAFIKSPSGTLKFLMQWLKRRVWRMRSATTI